MTIPGLRVNETDAILTIGFDRPEAFNALTGEMVLGLASLLNEASSRDDIRVVLITGSGSAFSAGADIGSEDANEGLDVRALDAANLVIRAIVGCDKPVLAGVNGVAAGFGLSIALACDLAVCAESATFLLAFARVGLMPDGGSTATVAASIGRVRAMRMALLAEPLSAREAYDAGLVSHVFEDEDFVAGLTSILKRLRLGAPLAQAATKRAVNAAALAQLESSLEWERTTQTMLLRTGDAAEGMLAFSQKRHPTFRGL